MAFSVRITGHGRDYGETLLELEPPWWDEEELQKDPRFTESNESGSYSEKHNRKNMIS